MKFVDEIEDCKRIQKVLEQNNTEATLAECEELWIEWSSSLSAGWLFLPKTDDEIWEILGEKVLERREQ